MAGDHGGRPCDTEHPGDVRVRCPRVNGNRDPAGGDQRDKGGGVVERIDEPDVYPGTGWQARVVQAALGLADDVEQARVSERRGATCVREVDVIAVAGGRLFNPCAYHEGSSTQYIIRWSL